MYLRSLVCLCMLAICSAHNTINRKHVVAHLRHIRLCTGFSCFRIRIDTIFQKYNILYFVMLIFAVSSILFYFQMFYFTWSLFLAKLCDSSAVITQKYRQLYTLIYCFAVSGPYQYIRISYSHADNLLPRLSQKIIKTRHIMFKRSLWETVLGNLKNRIRLRYRLFLWQIWN